MKWSGVVSFYASEHAMRSERVLERAGLTVRLVPGPREVSPNCGVAVAFLWEQGAEVEKALTDARIRFEAIHPYDLDDEPQTTEQEPAESGELSFFTRKRLLVLGGVAAFVIAIAAIGAVSRSSPTPLTVAPAASTPTVPDALWYWTMAVSPSDPNVLVLATAGGLYRSADGGKTWKPTGPKQVNATSLVQTGDSILMGGAAAPPGTPAVIRTGNARTASTGAAVFAASSDGGKSWQSVSPKGLPNASVQAMAVDPANDKTVYALLTNGNLYRSKDGGDSFLLVTAKLGIAPWALGITENSHFVSGDMDTGPHVSTNGTSWQRTAYADGRGGHMVMEYAVEPGDHKRVLMTSIGVVLSTDGGMTWHDSLSSSVMFGPVAWAPGSSSVAYAIGFDGSVWHTTDGGKSWKAVK